MNAQEFIKQLDKVIHSNNTVEKQQLADIVSDIDFSSDELSTIESMLLFMTLHERVYLAIDRHESLTIEIPFTEVMTMSILPSETNEVVFAIPLIHKLVLNSLEKEKLSISDVKENGISLHIPQSISGEEDYYEDTIDIIISLKPTVTKMRKAVIKKKLSIF